MNLLSTMTAIFLFWIVIVINKGFHVEAEPWTALVDACIRGDLMEVRRLLGPNCTDDVNEWRYDERPLNVAVENNHTRVTMLLLSCNADPNSYPYPIMHAVEHGTINMVNVLLGAGAAATINTQTYSRLRGWTPLMMASRHGHVKIVKVLINAGAMLDLKLEDCYTALMFASEYGHVDVVKVLLSAGAVVDISCWKAGIATTALILASKEGHLNIVNALIAVGARIDEEQRDGYTALMFASMYSHLDIVNALISAGAEVDKRNRKTSERALHIAVRKNQTEVVKKLLKHGADTMVTTRAGDTAEDIAREHGFTDILNLIQQNSVCINLYQ